MTCKCDNINKTHLIVSTSLVCDLRVNGEGEEEEREKRKMQ